MPRGPHLGLGPWRRFRLAYDLSELFRRYFINTIFDSTFVVLGIVSATAVVATPNVELTLGALAAACLAIGVSTGVSVYEAETLEAELRIERIERAMLAKMQDTDVHRDLRLYRTLVSLVNFVSPLVVLLITSLPFILHVLTGTPTPQQAAVMSIALAISLVFGAGLALGKVLGRNALRQALRMTIVALLTFFVLLAVTTLLA